MKRKLRGRKPSILRLLTLRCRMTIIELGPFLIRFYTFLLQDTWFYELWKRFVPMFAKNEDGLESLGLDKNFRATSDWDGNIGKAIIFFSLYSLRIYVVPFWTANIFFPAWSPIYMQGHFWAASEIAKNAILLHVSGGIVMMVCAWHQFDHSLRHSNKRLHRFTGRLYIISGMFPTCFVLLNPYISSSLILSCVFVCLSYNYLKTKKNCLQRKQALCVSDL
jgi:hypothetical protein